MVFCLTSLVANLLASSSLVFYMQIVLGFSHCQRDADTQGADMMCRQPGGDQRDRHT
jgi:hypothetical protein